MISKLKIKAKISYIKLTIGKQYKVDKDCIIKVEKLDAKVGGSVELDVLMVADNSAVKVGDSAKSVVVKGEVVLKTKLSRLISSL